MFYIDVVLPVPLQQNFTYHVPEPFVGMVQIGVRVIVQFGSRKFYTGLVKNVHQIKPDYETKPVEAVLDEKPVINPVQLEFWNWLSQYYMCSEGEVYKAALPTGLKLESKTQVVLNEDWCQNEASLKPSEDVVLNFIENHKKVTIDQINQFTRKNNAYAVVQALLKMGAVGVDEQLSKGYKPLTMAYVKIAEAYCSEDELQKVFDLLTRAEKQLQLLMLLISELNFFSTGRKTMIAKKALLSKADNGEQALSALVKKGFVELVDVEVDRLTAFDVTEKPNLELTQFQTQALNEVQKHFIQKQVVLLHGVTASGKTEIYIKLIEEQLKAGRQVLYLLPEIALTSQIVERLKIIFGASAGVYHSKFNDAERVEIWMKVLESQHDDQPNHRLVIGARSALFLPFAKLGLIIVDEEHDSSFKQFDPAPRYHARDAAIVLASMHKAKVLLGTATPSFESYFNAKTGKYGLVTLNRRFYNVAMPKIVVADLKQAYFRKEMQTNFSPQLLTEIENALANQEQVILFQNRRGFSPFLQCAQCGHIPVCKHCDVSLTFHKFHNNLQCHYCGYTVPLTGNCSACGSTDVKSRGFGTEKVEDDIQLLFPDAKVDRLDMDSTRNKHGFDKIINRFSEQKSNILVGTQMITKGLDFENVSVVGILNADNLLNFPDFRSFERAYQLMAQVSGRAGRKHKQGTVVIQTFQPDHPVIAHVIADDFPGLFNGYVNERKMFKYPPWFRIISITVKHKNNQRAQQASTQLANLLRSVFKNRVLGPEYPLIARIQLYYQLEIRIKLEKDISPQQAKKIIEDAIARVKQSENNASVIFSANVDPY